MDFFSYLSLRAFSISRFMGIPVSMDIYLTSSSNFLSIVVLIISRLILLFGRPSFFLFGRPIILLFMQVYIDKLIINIFID